MRWWPRLNFAFRFWLASLTLASLFTVPLWGQTTARYSPEFSAATVQTLIQGDGEQRLTALVNLAAIVRSRQSSALPDAVLDAVVTVLRKDSTPALRIHAARVLEFVFLGENAAGVLATAATVRTQLLTALAQERDLAVRKAILYALLPHRNSEVTQQLMALLKHKEVELRATAAYVLAEQADASAVPVMLKFLQHRRSEADGFARSHAARALGRMKAVAAIPTLLQALQEDATAEVKRETASALGELLTPTDAQTIASLQRIQLTTEDPYLHDAIWRALQRLETRRLNDNAPFGA